MPALCLLFVVAVLFLWYRLDIALARVKDSQERIDRLTTRVDILVDEFIIGVKPKG